MSACKRLAGILLALLLTAGCGSPSGPDRQLSSFTFLNQHNEAFGSSQLDNTVWVADFIFTTCDSVCSPMTSEMADLQKEFKENGLDVEFVSFTVDPEVDTPRKLSTYAGSFTDDQSNWHFLTGYSPQEISEFALENFQTIIQKPDTSNQVIHGTNFYLIAPGGRLVSEFNYVDEDYVRDLMGTVKQYLR